MNLIKATPLANTSMESLAYGIAEKKVKSEQV